eukprot:468680_1
METSQHPTNVILKTAIITGASAGIGKATTCRLLDDGWNVILISRSTDKMNKITSKCALNSYKIISCDLSKPELLLSDVIPKIKAFNKKIDLLLNNAGGMQFTYGNSIKNAKQIDAILPSFNWHINLMLITPYLLIKYLSMNNMFNMNASVINIGSLASHYGISHHHHQGQAYNVAKSGIQGLTKCLAFELSRQKGKKIRVNNVELGLVRTDWMKQSVPNISVKIEDMLFKSIANVTPLERCGTVDDIVEMILFLSDVNKSGWITGQNIVMDGGISLPLFHARPKL